MENREKMKIKTILQLSSALIAVTILVTGAVFGLSMQASDRASRKTNLSNEISRAVFEINALIRDYAASRQEYTGRQILTALGSLGATLRTYEVDNSEETIALEEIRKTRRKMENDFIKIAGNFVRKIEHEPEEQLGIESLPDFTNQLLIDSESLASFATKLHKMNQEEAAASRLTTIFLPLVVIVILLTATVFGSNVVNRYIVTLLSRLEEGTKIISKGNLDYRIMIRGNNEFSELSGAFNSMAAALKESYSGLEKKVEEKTHELKQKMEELDHDRAKDEALLSSIGEGMVATDKEGAVIKVSKSLETMFGWKSEDLLGKSVFECIRLADEKNDAVPKDNNPLQRALTAGAATSDPDIFCIRKDGTRFPSSITVSPVILGGKTIGAIALIRDITQEKELDRAKSEFVSLASHQLRTPITGIKWAVEYLLDVKGVSEQESRTYLDRIERTTKNLSNLVEAMLDVSRIETGRMAVIPTPFDAIEFIREYVNEYGVIAAKKNVSLGFTKHPEALPVVTDRIALQNVVQSLVSNALEYTPENGRVELSLEKRDHTFLVTVADTGIGIPREEQEKIFKKFGRASNAARMKASGTGLGLYLVAQVVKLLDGKVWFKSGEHDGTTFFVELPLRSEPRAGELQFAKREGPEI
ncbi:MAG: hypothetical protein A2939_03970 [Parcubacteria group bacterium RIFCSPLOWO2_01_FULL_48_18]|nr:MAG: hypothetical protein A2939_03970 [Parcubacteria group bacterium RIFCSPLOWO2_01_FULL_48_18]